MKKGENIKKSGSEKMSLNEKIAEIFYEMADILALEKVKWKPGAYIVAAQTLESLKQDVQDIYLKKGIKGLEELPGIGEKLAQKIIQYIETEKIDEHERLKKTIPAGVYQMMKIPGIGAKKAWIFFHELGIKNIDQLDQAVKKHKLRGVKGFKEKTEENILQGIEILKSEKEKMSLKEAEKLSNSIISQLKKLPSVQEAVPAGSLRRKKSKIRDLDIVIKSDSPEKITNAFVKMSFVSRVIGQGPSKATIISKDNTQIDIRVFPDDEFGAGLLYFTGDKQHNIWLRKIAIRKGLKLNEYGLFQADKKIAGKTEEEIYKALGLKMHRPEDRIGEIN